MTEKRSRHIPRWLTITVLLFVALIGSLVLGYIAWSNGSGKRLGAQIAEYKAKGEPIEPADFIPAPIADHENAAVALREAARIDEHSKEWPASGVLEDPALPLREKEIAAIRAVVAVNPDAFAGLDEAMKRTGVDWHIPMKSPVLSILLPDIAEQRKLARLVNWSAMLHFQQGDHAAALKDLQRIVFISRTMDQQPVLVAHLVALGQMNEVSEQIERMSPDLKIGTTPGDASPQQVAEMIATLLDDKPLLAGRRRAFQGERMIELDTARCMADGRLNWNALSGGTPTPAGTTISIALKPMALDDALIMIRHTTAYLAAMEASPDLPTCNSKAPQTIPPEIANAKVKHLLANMLLPSFANAAKNDYRGMTTRRLAATALTIRWYAVDHGGKPPEKLSDLVSKYLPALPLDAMADGQPIRYVVDPAKPILYSVGENGVDDGGSERVTVKQGGGSHPGKWQRADAVTHLTLQPRPPEEHLDDGVGGLSTRPTATQPVDAPME